MIFNIGKKKDNPSPDRSRSFSKFKRYVRGVGIALGLTGALMAYSTTESYSHLEHEMRYKLLIKKNVFFHTNEKEGFGHERELGGISIRELIALHEFMQTREFLSLDYPKKLSLVFKKSFELTGSTDYDKLSDFNERKKKIISALRLVAFGFSNNALLMVDRNYPSCYTREGISLSKEDEFFRYLSGTDLYNIIPSSLNGPYAYDKKSHFLLSIGLGIGQENPYLNRLISIVAEFEQAYMFGIRRDLVGKPRVTDIGVFDWGDIKADWQGQQLASDLLAGKVDMRTFDITEYMH